ncbi:MAG: hypothetical protein R3B90_17075 [Planctomycetaceae bacterium]
MQPANSPHRTVLAFLLLASTSFAVDVVVQRGTDERVGGTITNVTKTEVTVTKQVGGDTVVPVNVIDYIEWNARPAAMALGRSAALDGGQLEVARKQLETAITESAGNNNTNLRGDLDYMLARVEAEEALTDVAKVPSAIQKLKAFIGANRNHYRTFDAQKLLGNVAIAGQDFPAAIEAFTSLSTAPWKDYQMAARVGNGRTALAQGTLTPRRVTSTPSPR